MVLGGKVMWLTVVKKAVLEPIRRETTTSTPPAEEETSSFAERILKHRKVDAASSTFVIPRTSNMVERLFSSARSGFLRISRSGTVLL
ncbi:hypothetical protein PF003_g33326 [Phytophthora fragariae]|nr:hypothetical protein PF003_g33326 [Phytophthora fragariae]